MDDTINLGPLFLNPTVALKELHRCEQLAATFATKAADRSNPNPIAAAHLTALYRAKAERLRQIATNTAEHRRPA